MGIKHTFVSTEPQGSDPNKVSKNEWNDDHTIDGNVDLNSHKLINVTDPGSAQDAATKAYVDAVTPLTTHHTIDADVNFNSHKITSMADPSSAQDAATKAYVDSFTPVTNPLSTARGATLTIASGVITVTKSFHYVDTEAAASLDDLTTINGGTDGMRVILALANTSHLVHVKNNSGNILLYPEDGGYLLKDSSSYVELIYDATLANWVHISRFGHQYPGFKNVKDYGAVGDGVTDDRTAIQAAINDHVGDGVGSHGCIYFPPGTYHLATSLFYGTNIRHIKFLGAAGAIIEGSFNGYLFTKVGQNVDYGFTTFENLWLQNSNTTATTSGCVDCQGCTAIKFTNCRIGATGGIGILGEAQDVTVDTCALEGGGINSTSIGMMMANDGAVIDCDVVGWGVGLRHHNIGLTILSGRWEVNGIGIQLGLDASGNNDTSSATVISGCSMESNNIHIHVSNANSCNIIGVSTQSFNFGNTHGFKIEGTSGLLILNSGCAGSAPSVAGISMSAALNGLGGSCTGVVCINVGSQSGWAIDPNVDTTTWVNTNFARGFTNRYGFQSTDTSVPPNTIFTAKTVSIARGALEVLGNYLVIDTEGSAPSDNLDTLTGYNQGQTGARLVMRSTSASRIIKIRHGVGNIFLTGSDDFILDDPKDTITLLWDGNPTNIWADTSSIGRWIELSRSMAPTVNQTLIAGATSGGGIKANRIAAPLAGTQTIQYGATSGVPIGIAGLLFTSAGLGTIQATGTSHIVDTEAAAASDDLDVISGGVDGQFLVISAANDARTVVAKDGTGNLLLSADMTLDNSRDTLTLHYSDALAGWREIARSDNAA